MRHKGGGFEVMELPNSATGRRERFLCVRAALPMSGPGPAWREVLMPIAWAGAQSPPGSGLDPTLRAHLGRLHTAQVIARYTDPDDPCLYGFQRRESIPHFRTYVI